MMLITVSFFLLSGAFLCLLAATGVLRLPDVFMRMHAATKAGVMGCGLILIGVAIADGNAATEVKVAVTILFLLLTTPVAGHFLGRAAYVSGAKFWNGTIEDQLKPVLPRREFRPSASPQSNVTPMRDRELPDLTPIRKVILALAEGPHIDAAMRQAIHLALQHRAEVCGIAIIDAPRLSYVGAVPAGAGYHASELRKWRMAKARQAAADVIQRFESEVNRTDLKWSVRVEEGKPQAILRTLREPGCIVAVAPDRWFDQGVLTEKFNMARRIVVAGIFPVYIFGSPHEPEKIRRVHFVHDGSQRSVRTWRELIQANPWPQATLVIGSNDRQDDVDVESLLLEGRRLGLNVEREISGDFQARFVVIGNAGNRGWLPEWLIRVGTERDQTILAIG